MLSRSGSATVTPRPRRTVRRGMAFFVTIMIRGTPFGTTLGRSVVAAEEPPSKPGFTSAYSDHELLLWNGALFTMPSTNDENLYLVRCASLTIARTYGMSWYSMPWPRLYDN